MSPIAAAVEVATTNVGPLLLGIGAVLSAIAAGLGAWLTFRGSKRRDAVEGFDKLTAAAFRRTEYLDKRVHELEHQVDRMDAYQRRLIAALQAAGEPIPEEQSA